MYNFNELVQSLRAQGAGPRQVSIVEKSHSEDLNNFTANIIANGGTPGLADKVKVFVEGKMPPAEMRRVDPLIPTDDEKPLPTKIVPKK